MEKDQTMNQLINTSIVQFSIRDQQFGILLEHVVEIVRPEGIRSVPLTHPFMAGITSLRGEILAVVDMEKVLTGNPITSFDNTRLIIVNVADAKLALLVEYVSEILKIDEIVVEEDSEENEKSKFILEKVKTGAQQLLLVNLNELISEIKKVA